MKLESSSSYHSWSWTNEDDILSVTYLFPARLQLFYTTDVLKRWGAPNSFLLAPADAKVSIPIKVYQTTQQLSIKNQGNKIYLELWKPGYCWFSVSRHSKYWLASWHLGRVVEILFYISFGYCTQLERSYRNFQLPQAIENWDISEKTVVGCPWINTSSLLQNPYRILWKKPLS